MNDRILEWAHLTGRALDALDRERTVVLVTSSPLEVHGPHLPTVTDIAESEALMRGVAEKLCARFDDIRFVVLPPIYVAADVLPHVGSLKFRQSTIQRVFEDLGRSLCAQGFKHIWVSGFHGGPRHFTPIEVAAERVNRRHGGRMISVFGLLMTWLTGGHTDLSELLGDDDGPSPEHLAGDAHGGAIETSLMLHLLGQHVDPVWRTTGRMGVAEWLASKGEPPLVEHGRPTLPELFRGFAKKLRYYEDVTWSGNPSLASEELGRRYLDKLTDVGAEALAEVWTGARPLADCHSPTWKVWPIFTWGFIGHGFERLVGYRNRVW